MRVNDTSKRRYYTVRRTEGYCDYCSQGEVDTDKVTWGYLERNEGIGPIFGDPLRIEAFLNLEVGQQIEGYHYDTIIRLKDEE